METRRAGLGWTASRCCAGLLLLGVLVVAAAALGGCKKAAAKDQATAPSKRVVYHVVVRKVLPAPSAKVIAAIKRAIDAAKLDVVSSSTTNIDALFHAQSALRKEFKIEVEAVAHQETRVEISTLSMSDAGLAQILFDRIVSNL